MSPYPPNPKLLLTKIASKYDKVEGVPRLAFSVLWVAGDQAISLISASISGVRVSRHFSDAKPTRTMAICMANHNVLSTQSCCMSTGPCRSRSGCIGGVVLWNTAGQWKPGGHQLRSFASQSLSWPRGCFGVFGPHGGSAEDLIFGTPPNFGQAVGQKTSTIIPTVRRINMSAFLPTFLNPRIAAALNSSCRTASPSTELLSIQRRYQDGPQGTPACSILRES